MNRNQFYYSNMSENFTSCDVEIKSESQSTITESSLFPITNFPYESFNLGFNINDIKPPITQIEHKIIKSESPTQRKQREENRDRMRRFRLNLSEVEKSIRRQQNAQHMREFRKNLPEVEKQFRRHKAAEYMREFRRNLTEIEKNVRRKVDTERMRKFRNNLTEVEKEIRRQKAKDRMRRQREEIRMRNLSSIDTELDIEVKNQNQLPVFSN